MIREPLVIQKPPPRGCFNPINN